MKFKFKHAKDFATIREEETAYIKEFKRLDDFIEYCYKIGYPVIINYENYKHTIPKEIIIYDDYLE